MKVVRFLGQFRKSARMAVLTGSCRNGIGGSTQKMKGVRNGVVGYEVERSETRAEMRMPERKIEMIRCGRQVHKIYKELLKMAMPHIPRRGAEKEE